MKNKKSTKKKSSDVLRQIEKIGLWIFLFIFLIFVLLSIIFADKFFAIIAIFSLNLLIIWNMNFDYMVDKQINIKWSTVKGTNALIILILYDSCLLVVIGLVLAFLINHF